MSAPNPFLPIVRTHYPDAITTIESVDRMFDLLHRKYGLEPRQIMLADSICSDDVNSIEYPKRAYDMLGPFKMGGLDGFPFTGLTGMSAFAAHVPDDGAVFVYHAPHIGISKDGSVGTIMRVGQQVPSGCCGACRTALAKLTAGAIVPLDITTLDYQQNTIEQILLKHDRRILEAEHPLMEATEVMQEAISARIDLLASKTTYNARLLILMGAVMINGDHDMGSFTAIRRLSVKDLKSGATIDLLPELLA
jgi:Limiting CO2-inducible proteins B/C beta carbonyic anhydrases